MMNTLKVGFLLLALTALFLWIGAMVGGQLGLIIAFVLALVMNFGSYWFSDKVVIAMTRAQPVSEVSAPDLYRMVDRLAQRAGLPCPRIYLVNDPSPNAFATGRNPEHGVVAVHTGLLQLLQPEEIEGVLSHELAHIKSRDTLTMAIVASLAGAVMMLATMARFAAIFSGGSNRDGESPLGLLIAGLVAPLAATMIQMGISRSREFEADRIGARIAGTPRGLASALQKLERGVELQPARLPVAAAHLCIVNPFGALQGLASLFRTHPSTSERVRKLMELENA